MARFELTDEERARRREQKREQAEQALDALLSQEGWANWLRLRKHLHGYSWTNQILIAAGAYTQHLMAQEGHPDAPDTPCSPHPTIVKSVGRWKKDGYHPAKGSRGLIIWVFKSRRRKDGSFFCCGKPVAKGVCPTCRKPDHYFQLGPTFDASQVRSFETGEPPNIELPEGEPITGDDPGARLVGPLCEWALREQIVDSIEPHAEAEHGEGGSWNPRTRELRICTTYGDQPQSDNARLRTLIHELAHALGVTSKGDELDLTYAEAEVAVECVAFIVASTAGLDTSGEAIPYIAGWGGEDARQKVRALAQLIDATAKRLEEPLLALLGAHEPAGSVPA